MLALLATAASDCGRANRTWCSACSVSFSAYGDTGSGPFGVVGAGTFIYDLAAGRFRYDTWSAAASAFDPKAIGAPPCTQADSDAVAGALLASSYF